MAALAPEGKPGVSVPFVFLEFQKSFGGMIMVRHIAWLEYSNFINIFI